MPDFPGWNRLPGELRARKQWCVADTRLTDPSARKAPRIAIPTLPYASVTDPNTWSTFEDACKVAAQLGIAIGYVISSEDDVCCIDLDVKTEQTHPNKPETWTTQEELNRYWTMTQQCASYAERSLSGTSLHVWVFAKIGRGVRHRGVEIYSQERFMICTGDVIQELPLRDCQELIDATIAQVEIMQRAGAPATLVEIEEEDTDEEIFERACNAENGAKFIELMQGRWHQYGFPSQSEADLALMSMFTFYSASNEQCRRLFRISELGKREKATKNNRYLDYTLGLIRGRQERQQLVDLSAIQKAAALVAGIRSAAAPIPPPPQHTAPPPPPPSAAALILTAPPPPTSSSQELQWPPGLMGRIAHFVYRSAPRPVKEVAIVAAIGLIAGICGKAYNIPKSGLNVYMVLVARSAIGKESMHTGIAAILQALRSRNPAAMKFVEFSEFASGPALIKHCSTNPSFVNVCSEWGRRMKRIAEDRAGDSAMQSLRTAMTTLYQKSGSQSVVGGITYSNKDNSTISVAGVAYSMIGETTPKAYYECLTPSMMEDGFLSRFTMVEYASGERPPQNDDMVEEPDAALADMISDLAAAALTNNARGASQPVKSDPTATRIFRDFQKEADDKINSFGDDETKRQMWNRAVLKALRIAALLACCDNHTVPMITAEHTEWAIDLIRRDIRLMSGRIESGDIGISDDSRQKKVLDIIHKFLSEPLSPGYKVPPEMQAHGLIPRKYIQVRISNLAAFVNHRNGASVALDSTIRDLVDNGFLVEADKGKMIQQFNFHGKVYRVIEVPGYSGQIGKHLVIGG